MKKIIAFFMLAGILFQSGCGLIAVMASPTPHEQKITAEYDLSERKDQKILVLVNQPAWLAADVNLRYYLTTSMHRTFTKKVEIESENFVDYNKLSDFRSNRSDFAFLSAQEVGKALGADVVLVITILNYQLSEMPEADYYDGWLNAGAALFDVASGEKLWPESAKSKRVQVGFDLESRGRRIAIIRLANAFAHCTIRYLYGCPKNQFKIIEDQSALNWED